jgi:uncharacterized protein (DUF983 family)
LDWQSPDTARAALGGLCPRCGARTLYTGLLKFTTQCSNCQLDLTQFNVGDGAAAFLILIIGAIIMVLAVTLQLSLDPPFWVHILLWVPLTIGLVIGLLRIAKAALLSLEYQNRAREGRLADKP